jgi:HSP20 family protein
MERWHREIEQIFNGRADTSQPAIPNSAPWMPSVDLREEDDRFVLRADVPGVALADIEVSAENGALTIRGERPARERVSSDGFEHIERAAGTFLRRFTCRIPYEPRGSRRTVPMACFRSRFPSSLESRRDASR